MAIRFEPPATRYALSGEVNIAYQVIGEGPFDLILVPGWVSHLDYAWEEPSLARFYQRLASFSRLILFDKRWTGLSDRGGAVPTLEMRMDDVRAVMDAADSERAAVMGVSEGGPMSALFAATYPERTRALVLYGTYARRLKAPDYPWGPDRERRQKFYDLIQQGWGGFVDLRELAPSVADDERFKQWWVGYLRRSASPRDALALARMNSEIDIRPILPAIQAPTLVLHRRGDVDIDAGGSRYMAETIPGAKFVELPGADHLPWIGDSDALVNAVEEFLTGARSTATAGQMLGTVLMTDLVGSTEKAVALGDAGWRDLLQRHHDIVRRELRAQRGQELNNTGDGFVALFDGPARAVYCARAIIAALAPLGLQIRAGLHIGECQLLGGDVGGLTLHIAARVAGLAQNGEVWLSAAVKDLLPGAGLEIESRGEHTLKGIPGRWPLFAARET